MKLDLSKVKPGDPLVYDLEKGEQVTDQKIIDKYREELGDWHCEYAHHHIELNENGDIIANTTTFDKV